MKAVVDDEGKPYFSTEFLIREYLKLSDESLTKNQSYKASQTNEASGEASGADSPGSAPAGSAPTGATGETPAGGETSSELGAQGQL